MVVIILFWAAATVSNVQWDVAWRRAEKLQLTLTQHTLLTTVTEGTQLFSETEEVGKVKIKYKNFMNSFWNILGCNIEM